MIEVLCSIKQMGRLRPTLHFLDSNTLKFLKLEEKNGSIDFQVIDFMKDRHDKPASMFIDSKDRVYPVLQRFFDNLLKIYKFQVNPQIDQQAKDDETLLPFYINKNGVELVNLCNYEYLPLFDSMRNYTSISKATDGMVIFSKNENSPQNNSITFKEDGIYSEFIPAFYSLWSTAKNLNVKYCDFPMTEIAKRINTNIKNAVDTPTSFDFGQSIFS